jgi:N-acetyl sugar amidotransferase
MIRYCITCLLPATKPDLQFNHDGICQACLNFQNRPDVDWDARRDSFFEILQLAREKRKTAWDCVVPVSGGKDSSYQALTIKRLGFNPLAVTSRTCDLTPIGRRNIDNLRRFGVDHVEISPNPLVRARLNRIGLEEVGDISWPEHVGIFTIPVRASVMFEIPLIVWGENSQNEYGGPAHTADNEVLDRRWLEEFGGLLGLRVTDLWEKHGLSDEDLHLYTYPASEELARVGTRGIFSAIFSLGMV